MDKENEDHSPEFSAFAIQLTALSILCEMCQKAETLQEANCHRSKMLECSINIMQQSMFTLYEDFELNAVNVNIASVITLCKECENRDGLVAKEFLRRDEEYQKNQEFVKKNENGKVIAHPRFK